jgi:hypothetical protein
MAPNLHRIPRIGKGATENILSGFDLQKFQKL